MRRAAVTLLVAAEAAGALHYLGRAWGTTPEERAAPMPGDKIVD